MIKIALTGKMRSGKSTAAQHLFMSHGFERISFSSGLTTTADRLFSHLYYEEKDQFGLYRTKKPRHLLQSLGQKLREIDEDVFIEQATKSLNVYSNWRDCKGVVIDDLRQENEAKWAKENGFTIIRVNADESDRLARIERAGDDFKAEDLRHETEQYIDDIQADIDIWNGEGVSEDDLRRKIDEILAEIKAKGGR